MSGEQSSNTVHWCLVYDRRNGEVVHAHEFIGAERDMPESAAAEWRERMALDVAKLRGDPEHLQAVHPPGDFQFEPGAAYRIDRSSGQLVTVPQSKHPLRQLPERAQVTKKTARKRTKGRKK